MIMIPTHALRSIAIACLAFGISNAAAETKNTDGSSVKPTAKAAKTNTATKTPKTADRAQKAKTCRRDVIRLAKRKKLTLNKANKNAPKLISKSCLKAKFSAKKALKIAYKNRVFIKHSATKNDANDADIGALNKTHSAAYSNCLRVVLEIAKKQRLGLRGSDGMANQIIARACKDAQFKAKNAFKLARTAGAFTSADETADSAKTTQTEQSKIKGYLNDCLKEIKAHTRAKNLRPTVSGRELKDRINTSCKAHKYDGYLALKELMKAGLFTKVDEAEGRQNRGVKKASSASGRGTLQGKSESNTGNKTGIDSSKLMVCIKKVKYRIKNGKYFARSRAVPLNDRTKDACIKAKLNTRKAFGLVKRHLTKRRPTTIGKRKDSKQQKLRQKGPKKRPNIISNAEQKNASKKSLSKCKAQVWAIADKKGLTPLKGKSNVNKNILEQCRLNAYVASTVFRKVESLFGPKTALNQTPDKQSKAPVALPKIKELKRTNQLAIPVLKKSTKSESCRRTVAKIVVKKGTVTANKLPKATLSRVIADACRKTDNNAKAAAVLVLKAEQ